MATAASLSRDVLRDVSRSFYLSLRFLPSGFREPAAIGYLLARLSDTIADAGTVPLGERQELLEAFGCHAVTIPPMGSSAGWPEFTRDLAARLQGAGLSPGEHVLVERASDVFAAASRLESEVLASIHKVLRTIVSGQQWDLTRFAGTGCVALMTDEELDHYTYQVAGCVGEFWTEVAFVVRRDAARERRERMMAWGRHYGKGLQLVNILRDVPEDLARGRCYLPGVDPDDRAALMNAAARWRETCREWLQDGLRYAGALRGIRMRFASGLPALLGMQTIAALEAAGWDQWARGVKVSRRVVKRSAAAALAKSAWFLPGAWGVD
jgi:farnesyl-diphosphate farnesyltransferase